jgi:hypothetical protein
MSTVLPGIEGSAVDRSIPAHVYWNLHRKCWSIRQKGLVVAHVEQFAAVVTDWRVQPAGRDRVRAQRRKNVHAYAVVRFDEPVSLSGSCLGLKVVYNPYCDDVFRVVTAWGTSKTVGPASGTMVCTFRTGSGAPTVAVHRWDVPVGRAA